MKKRNEILEKGYTSKFYDEIKLNRMSAEIIVPIILGYVKNIENMKNIRVIDFDVVQRNGLQFTKQMGAQSKV